MPSIKYFIKNPQQIAVPFVTHYCRWLPDRLYLKLLFRAKVGYRLNLKNPKTFCEKLQWLKLYDRRPEYTTMVDKYAVKGYVASIIGEEYIIPTLGVWDRGEDIEWDTLPNQFVLKTTHSGGATGVVICRDKSKFDREKAVRVLNESLKDEYYSLLREWPYKNVQKRIIAEKYLQPDSSLDDLSDYKFYCFDGEPKLFYITSDRNKTTGLNEDFFDVEGNLLPVQQKGEKNSVITPPLPKNLNLMLSLAHELSRNIPQVRVDFYEVHNKVYFGELTFYCGSGFCPFQPLEWERRLGDYIILPSLVNS